MDLRLTDKQIELRDEVADFLVSMKAKNIFPFTSDSMQLVFSPEFSLQQPEVVCRVRR